MFNLPKLAAMNSSPLNGSHANDAVVLDQVRDALTLDRLQLAFQPAVNFNANKRVSFYEGLIRMFDSAGNIVSAADFIPLIEDREEGRLVDIAALNLGLKALRKDPTLRLSINLSPRSIGHRGWNSALAQGLAIDPTVAERLILEITESSMIETPDLLRNFMTKLQSVGITFALDDFGAGYTAFRHFKDFRFDIVKIDRAFIDGIASDTGNQVIVGALKIIADEFEMMIVAEGVEALDDAEYLRAQDIDIMQGYYFGRPNLAQPDETNFAQAC